MRNLKLWNLATLAAAATLVVFSSASFADVIPAESQEPVSRKNVELPESSPSSPPLETDDPGTPGDLGFEINFIMNTDIFATGNNTAGGVDANLGIGDRLQLRIEKDARREALADSANFYGAGATDVGVKYRFYDDQSLKMAIYPSFNFDDGTKREGAESEGRSFYVPIIISKALGRFTIIGNAGIKRYLDASYKRANTFTVALGYALSETTRLMSEVASEYDDGVRNNAVRIGAVKEIFPNEASKYETGVFGSIGESFGPTEDGLSHTTVLVGLSFARKPE